MKVNFNFPIAIPDRNIKMDIIPNIGEEVTFWTDTGENQYKVESKELVIENGELKHINIWLEDL